MPETLNLVAAVAQNSGIGLKEDLPWGRKLKSDLQFFNLVTTLGYSLPFEFASSDKTTTASVIMGRKTWESIPQSKRPLPGRTNIVVTRNPKFCDPAAVVCSSLESAIEAASGGPIFIAGGSDIYKAALDSGHPCRLFITRVHSDFPADAFFPDLSPYSMQSDLNISFLVHSALLSQKVKQTWHFENDRFIENDISFSFHVLEKIQSLE